jgi:excisionase family DNA binding protein
VTVLGVLVACIMFALLARAFVQSYGERPPENPRIATDPEAEEWLHVDEVATLLAADTGEVMNLVERGSIPFYVVPGLNRFRRDEIDGWVIG